jgi:mannose-1-phosphate guanylyltransferase/mannose-6-phosphate isomerase
MGKITPVIMSGGAGTRLWPVSRVGRPKQFHALGGERTLIQETALRAMGEGFAAPMVVCNASHAALAAGQLRDAGFDPLMVLEPVARNTAACAVAAAALVSAQDPEGLILLVPADHIITETAAYKAAIEAGRLAAEAGELVVFGLRPERPETGYGYIRSAGHGDVRRVAAFVEKPDAATASAFAADPAYSWNAGIFLFKARVFLEEARRLAPEVAAAAEEAVAAATRDGREVRLGEGFAAAPAISVDHAIFEKTDKAAVVVCPDLGWSDVGAWRALWELSGDSEDRNALRGDVVAVESSGCLVRTDGPTVALAGVEDLVVIVEDGVVLVAAKDNPSAVKALVEQLRAKGRRDLL